MATTTLSKGLVSVTRCQCRVLRTPHVATLRIFPRVPPIKNTNIPEKYRLPIMPKVPSIYQVMGAKPPKETKDVYKLQGEERVHNKLLLRQYAIIAISAGMMKPVHFEMLRAQLNRRLEARRSFAIYRVDAPYKPITLKGLGKRLGGGKGKIKHYETPVRAGRVVLEVGGKVLWEEVQPWLSVVATKLPFEAIAVSQDLLDRLNAEEKRLEETNENPYTFEWIIRNNMFDCQRYVSPRDLKWFGRFVYRDRTLNKMWTMTRQSPPGRK